MFFLTKLLVWLIWLFVGMALTFPMAQLPWMLFGLFIVVIAIIVLYIILSKVPEPAQGYIKWGVLVIGGLIVLWLLIDFYQKGSKGF